MYAQYCFTKINYNFRRFGIFFHVVVIFHFIYYYYFVFCFWFSVSVGINEMQLFLFSHLFALNINRFEFEWMPKRERTKNCTHNNLNSRKAKQRLKIHWNIVLDTKRIHDSKLDYRNWIFTVQSICSYWMTKMHCIIVIHFVCFLFVSYF